MIKTGKVSSINRSNGTVQVVFADQNDMVSNDLPMLSFEYEMPDVGDQVLCLFLDNAPEWGFCLGRFYCDAIPGLDKKVIRRRMEKNKDDSYIEYEIDSGNMNLVNAKADVTIDAKGKVIIKQAAAVEITTSGNVQIDCTALQINGNVNVNGSIHATGSIIDSGGNTNHHVH